MIIDTDDSRRLEVEATIDQRLFMMIEGVYGECETIILDKAQVRELQSYLDNTFGEWE